MSSLTPPLRPAALAAARLKRVLAVVAAVCVGGLAAGVGPALAAFPGQNGKIAFASDRAGNGNNDIWVMSPTGGKPVNLTPDSPAGDGFPNWRADGRKIVFQSNRETPGNPAPEGFESPDFEIFTMNADGSDVRQITFNELDDEDPAWSPDGRRIVFARDLDPVRGDVNYDIFTMTASGAEERNITNDPALFDVAPNWSPSGRRIAFTSDRDGDAEIYTVNTDGSRVHRLTSNTSFDGYPNWSPNGQKIAFQSDRDDAEPNQVEIYTMRTDGRDQRRLTFHAFPDYTPAWSPNGCKIAYIGFPDVTAEDPFANADVFTINVDGSDQENLTNDPRFDFAPDWQPLGDHRGDDDDHDHGGRDQAARRKCRG
jgi:Tol biopolymer transport system component